MSIGEILTGASAAESWEPEAARQLGVLAELLEPRAARLDLPRLETAFAELIGQG